MSGRGAWRRWVLAGIVAAWGIAPVPGGEPGVRFYRGMCDASALVPLGARHQVAGDDEDNRLRVYDREAGGLPVWSIDLSRFLAVDPQEPEVDLEAAARVGDRIYWISSHGRNRKGHFRVSRHRFFATGIRPGPGHPLVEPVGVPSMRLLADLLADRRLAVLGLGAAAGLAPKAPGALNIEGLVDLPDGRLLIGFRNPQPGGRALLVPFENPAEVVAGAPARFGDPVLLDLEGRGVRGLGREGDRILIAAGASDQAPRARFFEWVPGDEAARELQVEAPDDLNPESIEPLPGSGDGTLAVLVASDDGALRVGGRECKRLRDPGLKRFRAAVLAP